MFPYRVITGTNGVDSVTAFNPDAAEPVFMADPRHPHFEAILEGLRNEDPNVWSLFDVATGVAGRLQSITDRVSYDGKNILWDGDVVPDSDPLMNAIKRALEAGESNYEALAKFKEKLENNPNAHSKAQGYAWLASHDFKITPEGDIVGYKGVFRNGDGKFRSWHASNVPDAPSAYINGVPLPPRVYVEQSVGDVVSMPRSEVIHDPTVACNRGLHVGTFSYAQSYGDTVLEVHVHPRDFVSVPTHAGGEKARVCKYRIARVATTEHTGSPVVSSEPAWEGDVGYRA